MRRFTAWMMGVLLLIGGTAAAGDASPTGAAFVALPVVIDPGGSPLAAWQVEVHVADQRIGRVQLVGIEGGGHPAYAEPAFHVPDAQTGSTVAADADVDLLQRIVVAAFSTLPADELPTRAVRVATLMLRVEGGVGTELELVAAADHEGAVIEARLMNEAEAEDPRL